MLVDEHHLAGVDLAAQGRVGLERDAAADHVGVGQHLVDVVAQGRAGHQGDLQRLAGSPLGQRKGHRLAVTGAGEAAHADGHAVAKQFGGGFGRHDAVPQAGKANTIHGHCVFSDPRFCGAHLDGRVGGQYRTAKQSCYDLNYLNIQSFFS
jgi:hypothetical protein